MREIYSATSKAQEASLLKLLAKVESAGLDVRKFRRSYMERRLATRLRSTGCADYMSYHRYLEQEPTELTQLLNALTINVTEFFRNKDVFSFLETKVVPSLIASKQTGGRLRVWSAGCSSGEEAFTMAMIIAQCLEKSDRPCEFTVHGTDIDEQSLAKGRRAVYPAAAVESIPPRFHRYLVEHPSGFSFTDEIKSRVRFKRADLFVDVHLRLVSLVLCRNVLIYFDRQQQEDLVGRFMQALTPGGVLTIGKSEKLYGCGSRLIAVDSRCRIYSKPRERV